MERGVTGLQVYLVLRRHRIETGETVEVLLAMDASGSDIFASVA
jgi:hypothetical protein